MSHPFLVEIGDGTLPLQKFRYYVKQDYVYLLEFTRCLSLAIAKTEDIETMRELVSLLEGCLTVEIDLLIDLAQNLSLSKKELIESEASPTNMGYTRKLLYVAYSGTLGEIFASLLPCMWTYQDIGKSLIDNDGLRDNSVYFEWVNTYRGEKYIDLVNWYKELTNRYSSESGTRVRKKMREHFMTSIRYEYMFWNMAYNMEEWPT